MEHRSRNVGERCEEVAQKSSAELIILGDPPEEKIPVHLKCQFESTDGVVVDRLIIGCPVKIGVDETEVHLQLVPWLIGQRCRESAAYSLEGRVRIVDSIALSVLKVEVDLPRCIGCTLCAKYCPWETIEMLSFEDAYQVAPEWTLRNIVENLWQREPVQEEQAARPRRERKESANE